MKDGDTWNMCFDDKEYLFLGGDFENRWAFGISCSPAFGLASFQVYIHTLIRACWRPDELILGTGRFKREMYML